MREPRPRLDPLPAWVRVQLPQSAVLRLRAISQRSRREAAPSRLEFAPLPAASRFIFGCTLCTPNTLLGCLSSAFDLSLLIESFCFAERPQTNRAASQTLTQLKPQTLTFFHENGITHGDLCEGNILTNVVVPHFVISGHRVAGLRGPERLYAFTDFETCVVDSDSIWRFTNTFVERAWADVYRVAEVLEAPFHRICAEGSDPALLTLLGKMQSPWRPPNAAKALARFNEICAPLTDADLDIAITSIGWYNGKLYPREKPIMYSLPPRES